MRERRLRRRREVGPARADPDHEVGLGGDAIGRERARHADRAERGADGRTEVSPYPPASRFPECPSARRSARSASVAAA